MMETVVIAFSSIPVRFHSLLYGGLNGFRIKKKKKVSVTYEPSASHLKSVYSI